MFSYAVMSDRCLLAVVLATAAIGKLWHRSELVEFGRTLRLGLRLPGAGLVAGAWVGVEGLTALLLALPQTVGYAAGLAALEFGCLTAGVALLAAQRRDFGCSCFGGGRTRLSWRTALRNGVLTLAAIGLTAALRLPASAASAPVALAAVLTVLTGAVLAGHARPLGVLLRQSTAWRPATRAVPAPLPLISSPSPLAGGQR